MTKGQYAQWAAALVLFSAWMYLVIEQVKGADDIITCIKDGLGAFGLYCWNERAVSKGIDLATAANGGGPGSAQPFQPPQ